MSEALNYRYLRVATAVSMAFGLTTALTLLRAIELPAPYRVALLTGLALPLVFGAMLFFYKTTVGIRAPWLGLSYWAMWSSGAALPAVYLLCAVDGAGSHLLTGALLLAQLANVALALKPGARRGRALVAPASVTALCFTGQVMVIRLLS